MTPAEAIAEASVHVSPDSAEESRVGGIAEALLKKTRSAAQRHPETRGALLGGSFAKGTWLPRHVDLDVFVKFDPSTSAEDFERIGLAIGREATRGHPAGKKFAQHPYTESTLDGVRVNIVPCFDVKRGEWKSAADRSPYHVELVEGIPSEKKQEMRLLKRFMIAIGVYGAEIERQGFSGYVAEVLVLKFGTALGVLDWFAGYNLPKTEKAFSLLDPVDSGRDLGTAVSPQSVGRMVLASREFLRRPKPAYFRKMTGKTRPSLRKEVVAVAFSHRVLSEDTLWGELRRTTRHLVRHLEVLGFPIARSMAASNNRDRSAILLIPLTPNLPPIEQRVGPTVDRKEDVKAFVGGGAKGSLLSWVDEDARVRVLRRRKYTALTDLLMDVAKGRSGPIGASKELGAGMRRTARILRGASLARRGPSEKWLEDGVREITTDAVGTG